ncbi:MAG: pyrimidine/purine nucleoside phosphorylase [Planctomycetota bacterium]|nr:pyrimidine/purine nucleoside phosphorylase [Planctomycetota bacterium]
MSTAPEKIENVTAVCKANVYFDGKVVSHTILSGQQKRTLGLIYPGSYTFNTGAPERMDIIAGVSRMRLAGQTEWKTFAAGTFFRVPGHSSFEIAVDSGIAEYLCSFE